MSKLLSPDVVRMRHFGRVASCGGGHSVPSRFPLVRLSSRDWRHAGGRKKRCRASTDSESRTERASRSHTEEASTSGQEEEEWRGVQLAAGKDLPYALIAALTTAGALLTGYLTTGKLTGAPVACPASGSCDTVLSSGYATVLGVPLSLIGCLAYSGVAGLAGLQATRSVSERSSGPARYAVLAGTTVLAATSSCLLFLLATQFSDQTCVWCLASATLSFGAFFAAASGLASGELADVAAPGGIVAAATVLTLFLSWSGVQPPPSNSDISLPYVETVVRQASSTRSLSLARRLKAAGARMYGAFWCSHCQEQKLAFGREAQPDLPYIECFPNGYFSAKGTQMAGECREAGIQGFPLWAIGDQKLEGEQSFDKLEAALDKLPDAPPN